MSLSNQYTNAESRITHESNESSQVSCVSERGDERDGGSGVFRGETTGVKEKPAAEGGEVGPVELAVGRVEVGCCWVCRAEE